MKIRHRVGVTERTPKDHPQKVKKTKSKTSPKAISPRVDAALQNIFGADINMSDSDDGEGFIIVEEGYRPKPQPRPIDSPPPAVLSLTALA